jgi:hypothetical protein
MSTEAPPPSSTALDVDDALSHWGSLLTKWLSSAGPSTQWELRDTMALAAIPPGPLHAQLRTLVSSSRRLSSLNTSRALDEHASRSKLPPPQQPVEAIASTRGHSSTRQVHPLQQTEAEAEVGAIYVLVQIEVVRGAAVEVRLCPEARISALGQELLLISPDQVLVAR